MNRAYFRLLTLSHWVQTGRYQSDEY